MVTVTLCGEGGYSAPVTGSQTPPGVQSVPVAVTNIDGDWMFALVTWRQLPTLGGTTITVGDDVHNFWEPLGQPNGTSSANGVVRTAIWYAPAAKAASQVLIAPTGVWLGCAVTIVDAGGLPPWVSATGIRTEFAAAASSLPSMSPAPGAPALIFTTFGNDGDLLTSQAGSGWTALPSLDFSNGVDDTSDIALSSAWQVASSATSTWSAAGTANLCGLTAGTFVSVSAPAQASPLWPVTITEIAPGAGPATPPDQITWVPLNPRSLALSLTQGRQYNLGTLQAGSGVLTLDNPDGAVMPPGSGAFAGIDSGTPVRTRQIWTGGAWQAEYSGNGTTAGPQIDTGNIFTVSPGQPYSAAAWLACSVPYAAGQTVSIRWKTSGGTLISSATSNVVTGTVPVLATASGLAPAGAALASVVIGAASTPAASVVFSAAASPPGSGYLVIPPAVSWTAENSATRTILAAWTADVRGAPVVTPYSVPAGAFMQKWPRQWNADTYRGQTAATITDAWGYCNGNLQPILQQEIINDLPYAYWPCTDAPGAAQAANVAAGNGNPLMVAQSKYGTGGTTQEFGANSDALLGAQGTLELTSSVRDESEAGMWQQTLPSGVTTAPIQAQGHSLSCTDSNFPPVAAGVTFELWFQVMAPYQFGGGTDFITESVLVVRNTVNVLFSVLVIGNGGSLGLIEGAGLGGAGNATIGISGVDYRAMTGLQHLVITTTRTAWTAYLNGVETASGSWAATLNQQFSVVSVNGDITQVGGISPSGATGLTGTYNCYSGYAGHVAVFPQILSPQRILTHYIAGQYGMAGDSVQERIERLLQAAPFLGRRVMLPDPAVAVTAVASCQDIGGQAAAISIQNVAGSTPPAVLSVTPAGEIFYLSRTRAWNQPARWVLGDAPWLGEIPCKPGFSVSYDPLRVVNDIQLTQLDNLDIVTPSGLAAVPEAASQAQYGDQSYWQTGYLQGDLTEPVTFGPGLGDEANWIATTNVKPVTRLDQVTVDAAGNPAAWQFYGQAAAGDMITVNIRPPTSTEVITVTGRISQTQRALQFDQDQMTGSIQSLIDAAPEQAVLTADDPVLGQLTGGHPLAW